MKQVFFLLFLIPQFLFAQEDSMRLVRDSVRMKLEGQPEFSSHGLLPERMKELPLLSSENPNRLPEFSLKEVLRLPYQTNPSLLFRGDYSTSGILKQFMSRAARTSRRKNKVVVDIDGIPKDQ